MSIATLNARRKAAGLPLIRFAVRALQADDLQDLRDAFAAMYEITELAVGDRRGYWALARGHGYDLDLCHDDDRIFLTWHRAYVYAFEKALAEALRWKRQDRTLELTLPFWDWTKIDPTTDAANGIPRALDDAQYVDANGAQHANPLFAAKSMYRAVSQSLPAARQFTQRFPAGFAAAVPGLANDVARYLTNPNFARFSADFDQGAHGTVHVRVGGAGAASPLPGNRGDMSSVVSAAFDPIFWLHHAMVDKVWFDWQQQHGDAGVSAHVRQTAVYDGFLGSDVLDAEHSLRYIYSEDSVDSAEEVGGTIDVPDVDAAPAKSAAAAVPTGAAAPTTQVLRIGLVHGRFRRAQLDFHQLRPPKDSFEVRVFINNPTATVATDLSDPSYGGRMVLFGHGDCHGAPGHCNPSLAVRDEYDQRAKHPLRSEHTRYCIDMTRGLRRALAAGSPMLVDLTLVVVDLAGQAVPVSSIRHRGVSLSTR